MTFSRRDFLHLTAGAGVLSAQPSIATAQSYPVRPVRVVVGYAAGSASDIIARLLAQRLSDQLGQQFVVENRTGAATNLAAEDVSRARPDGYTLLLVSSTNAVNATLYKNLNFDFSTDIVPLALIDVVPYALEINPSLPVKTLPEFIAFAKASPGQINMASQGIGSGPHVAGELFQMMTGTKFVHIPYTGMPYADLIAGQVQIMFSPITASIGYVNSGQLRPLAVASPSRLSILPDVPTIAETIPGFDASGWHGLAAPKGIPAQIADTVNKAATANLADPAFKSRLADLGGIPMPMTSAEFGKFVTADIEKWAKVIKFADIKPA